MFVPLLDKNIGLSQILTELLKVKGLTASELARKVCVPQPTIQRITSGKHARPHQKTLKAISNFFNITIEQLCGNDPIAWLPFDTPASIHKVPLMPLHELKNTTSHLTSSEQLTIDLSLSSKAFAIRMPDSSMEPLIQQNAILIIDPEKTPQYKNFVLVKIKNFSDLLVRQLIKDAYNCYIKPLNHDFDHINIIKLGPDDAILGVIVEIRLLLQ
jgi:transcriptional regulator with XRE-family HTH domain